MMSFAALAPQGAGSFYATPDPGWSFLTDPAHTIPFPLKALSQVFPLQKI